MLDGNDIVILTRGELALIHKAFRIAVEQGRALDQHRPVYEALAAAGCDKIIDQVLSASRHRGFVEGPPED